jgi:hypothetical protein
LINLFSIGLPLEQQAHAVHLEENLLQSGKIPLSTCRSLSGAALMKLLLLYHFECICWERRPSPFRDEISLRRQRQMQAES